MNKEIMKLMKSGIRDLETGVGETPTPATGTVALPENAIRNLQDSFYFLVGNPLRFDWMAW